MTKIVYNACFGGFSLSDKAICRYAELKGLTLYPEPLGYFNMSNYYTEPPGEKVRATLYDREIDRADPLLVQVVEELGEDANGMCADLQIEDVPTGTAYRIDDYDGNERVMTNSDYEWKVA